MVRTVSLLFISGFFLVFLSNCSPMHTVFGLLNFWDTGKKDEKTVDKKIGQFVSTVRPMPNQGNPDSHYLLALHYQKRGSHQQAIREFEKAVSIDPEYAKAYNGMAVSYDLSGDFAKAVEYYKMALHLKPDLGYVKNNLGYSYLLQGKYDEAIVVFQEILSVGDASKRVRNNLGLAYAMKGDFDRALNEFSIAGNESMAHYHLATFLYKKGLFAEAKSHYSEAVRLDPFLSEAHSGLAAATSLAHITAALPAMKAAAFEAPQHLTAKEERGDAEVSFPEERIAEVQQRVSPIGIEVSNGNGVNGMARKISGHLNANGFKVIRVTNADHFNYRKSTVLYQKGFQDAARRVARQVASIKTLTEMQRPYREKIKVKVLIGKDLISSGRGAVKAEAHDDTQTAL